MSFPLHQHRDFTSLPTLSEEPDSPRESLSEASAPSSAASPNSQTRSIKLVSPRPALASWPSFTTTSSSSSSSDNSKRIYKSKLTPDDFLLHAFGSTGRRSRQPLPTPPPSFPSSVSGTETVKQSCYPLRPASKSTKRHIVSHHKRYSLPDPPPSGTFTTTKHPKIKTSERPSAPSSPTKAPLSITEMEAFSGDLVLPQQEPPCANSEKEMREPLLTDEQWREKARQRTERRKHFRAEARQGNRGNKMPIDIDCRPMEGSLGFPDSTTFSTIVPVSAARKGSSSLKHTCASEDLGHIKSSKQATDRSEMQVLKFELEAPSSKDNLDVLVAQSAAVSLSDSPQAS